MANRTPQRFTSRVTGVPRRVGRALEGAVDTDGRYGKSVDVNDQGRLEVRLPSKGGSLEITERGLELKGPLGDKNLVRMTPVDDVAASLAASPAVTTISTTVIEIRDQLNALLVALRKTFRLNDRRRP